MQELIFTVTDFVAVLNQTLDFAYPIVTIEGELSNLRVSRGKWVYFDIKDETASVKCFGTVYMLPGPLEDGMVVRINATPRLHTLYNFSLNIQSIMPVGQGSLKRAADLLMTKLQAEGLFDPDRKRLVPYAPARVGLITSRQSAAYADFVKILDERWAGVKVVHIDTQVQGEAAISDITAAITAMNQLADPPEVLIITRGGGSAEDLAVFNTEQITRAVAASRIPTLVAIGHEVDISLAELAADQRASTPSNAAQLLVPEKTHILLGLKEQKRYLAEYLAGQLNMAGNELKEQSRSLCYLAEQAYLTSAHTLARQADLLEALNPQAALSRGYAVVRSSLHKKFIKSLASVKPGDAITVEWYDGSAEAVINKVQ